MATLQQIRDAVNARLAVIWPKIKTRQETYRAAKGRYFQGIVTSAPPDDGATASAVLTLAPTDQFDYVPPVRDAEGAIVVAEVKTFHTWAYFANADIPSTLEMALRIDVYEGPGGVHGYFCTCLVTKNAVTYYRTAQVENGVELTTGTWLQE